MQLPLTDPRAAATLPLRIITHNIRYAASDLKKNEKPWKERRHLISSQLKYHTRNLNSSYSNLGPNSPSRQPGTAIVGLQEVLHEQLIDIMSDLNEASDRDPYGIEPNRPEWAYIGVGREDGGTKGEYSPIIYSPTVFRLLHHETVWLSPTPEKPSIGWDAGSIRILTIGIFEHKASGQRILACNTHLDNAGVESRSKSVDIIIAKITMLRQDRTRDSDAVHSHLPVLLTGDFNSFPTQEAYLQMWASDLVYDLREKTDPCSRYGDGDTFTGFDETIEDDDRGRIDFIWLGPKWKNHVKTHSHDGNTARIDLRFPSLAWTVEGYAVLPNFFNGMYCSDHKAVVGDVCLHRWSQP